MSLPRRRLVVLTEKVPPPLFPLKPPTSGHVGSCFGCFPSGSSPDSSDDEEEDSDLTHYRCTRDPAEEQEDYAGHLYQL